MNQAEALRLAVDVLTATAITVVSDNLASRLVDAVDILDEMTPYYTPGSDAWVAVAQ